MIPRLRAGALILGLSLMSVVYGQPETPKTPNFVLIFCDDLGYGDLGPYGSELHRTPHLDRMAAEGRRFTDFYVTSGVCSPSRASLMTGCYPKRVGLHQNERGAWVLFPGNHRGLNPEEITMAEVLKQQGYRTACVGKWHLGDQPRFLPTRQGFDYYFGIPYSNDMGKMNGAGKVIEDRSWPPLPLLRNETVIETEPDQSQLTRRYTEEAIQWIEAHREEPFFLYLPHTMPHAPQFASEKFAGQSANGKWGDAVEELDWSTGEILKALRRWDLDKETLVVFMSDNGGAEHWGADNGPLRGGKGSVWEGGQRVPFLAWLPGTISPGTVCREWATSMDLMPTFARMAGGAPPSDRLIDGKDIRPLLFGEPRARTPHIAFYYYFKGHLRAVRSGRWKLHVPGTREGRGNRPAFQAEAQLYDLREDVGETRNVADKHPLIVGRLEALADEARRDLGDDSPDHRRPGENTRNPGHVENAAPLRMKNAD